MQQTTNERVNIFLVKNDFHFLAEFHFQQKRCHPRAAKIIGQTLLFYDDW
jgi:hypothetical protein